MKKALLIFLALSFSILGFGCAHMTTGERALLKTLADEKGLVSSERLFGETYDTANSRLMSPEEIDAFLRERNISAGSLPPGLQKALEEKRVTALLVTSFRPIKGKDPETMMMLSGLKRMLLMWEMRMDGVCSVGGLWLDGKGGSGEDCKDADKCDSYPDCCVPFGNVKYCLCIGLYKCPPCQECRPCSAPPVASLGGTGH